jgi:ankyrin repeat protein
MTRLLPEHPNLEHLKNQAKDLLRSLEAGDSQAVERYRSLISAPVPRPPQLSDAQHAIAREYGFTNWAALKHHVEASADESGGASELVAAIHADDVERAARVLEQNPGLKKKLNDPLPGLSFGATPLIAALPWANRKMIDLLLESGSDINQRSHWWAGGFGVLDHENPLQDYLIERGARIDACAAARLGRMDVLERLVAANPDAVHARGGDGQTPLHFARNVEVARWLLDRGADIDARDVDHESTPAQYMARNRQDAARFLVERGCRTDLLLVSALGDLDRARRHLDADPACIRMTVSDEWFPKQNPHSGGTIYIWTLGGMKNAHLVAREFGHEDVLALLLERSPESLKLALACELGDEDLFRRMLAARPDLIHHLTDDDRAKFVSAAQNNNARAVHLMLEAGWPTTGRGQLGGTALHWAAWHGNVEMARDLLKHGLSVQTRDWNNDAPPMGWAIHGSKNGWHRDQGDYAGVVEALLDAGAEAPQVNDRLETTEPVLEVLRRRAKK